jgi:hypothetical protein
VSLSARRFVPLLAFKHVAKTLCPEGKLRVRLADSGGLHLEVVPSGPKRLFWKYYFTGKEMRLALGSYPDVGLK